MFLVITIIFVSCSAVNNSIQKNRNFTEKLMNSLFKEKGNVFYLNSTNSTFSILWVYNKSKIEIYRLANGKIFKKEEYNKSKNILYQIEEHFSKKIIYELDSCMELDGDGFGFKIMNDSNIIKEDLPINIECFRKGKYQSVFFSEILRDISNYKMWDIKVMGESTD